MVMKSYKSMLVIYDSLMQMQELLMAASCTNPMITSSNCASFVCKQKYIYVEMFEAKFEFEQRENISGQNGNIVLSKVGTLSSTFSNSKYLEIKDQGKQIET